MSNNSIKHNFLTTDIGLLFEDASPTGTAEQTAASANSGTESQKTKAANYDWSKELQNRIEANKQLSTRERKNVYLIEEQLFTEFFTAFFKDDSLVKRALAIGEILRKDIRTLGFKKSRNPILAFLGLKYVQNNLILTELLNSNTYKAIHNVVAKKLVADSEFYGANSYNILYCRDLYKLPPSEIVKYFIAQAKVLKPDASTYEPAELLTNRKLFFYINLAGIEETDIAGRIAAIDALAADKVPSAKTSSTRLNRLSFINNRLGIANNTVTETSKATNENTADVEALINKIQADKSVANAFVAIQCIEATIGLDEAKNALKHNKFKDLNMSQVLQAITTITPIMRKQKLSRKEASTFVRGILHKLSQDD